MKKLNKIISIIIIVFFTSNCSNHTPIEVSQDEYFNKFFIRTGNGFTGGDGTYSVLLPDGRTVWIFGDTFLGTVEADGSRKKSDPMYIRNSFVVQDKDSLITIHQNINGKDHSTVIPPHVIESNFEITEKDQWYWPGDGYIENNELKVFMSEFHQLDTGMWDFKWQGIALASFSLPDLKQTNIKTFDFPNPKEIHYGHAILEDKEFIYIYGLGQGKVHVARVTNGKSEGPWEFYTNNGWNSSAENSLPIADISTSEQFSVIKFNGKYVFITQLGDFSKDVCSFISDYPYKDFTNKQVLFSTYIPENETNWFTYNAVVHPQFSDNNTLLISYNTNSFILADHFKNADIYRPRFVRVSTNKINIKK